MTKKNKFGWDEGDIVIIQPEPATDPVPPKKPKKRKSKTD